LHSDTKEGSDVMVFLNHNMNITETKASEKQETKISSMDT